MSERINSTVNEYGIYSIWAQSYHLGIINFPFSASNIAMKNMTTIREKGNNALTIVQLSDMHLHSEDSMTLHGYKTNQRFNKVIDYVRKYEQIKPDIIFLTGDISQDMSERSYALCSDLIRELDIDTYWIAGNHDDPGVAQEVFSHNNRLKPLIHLSTDYWDFISINSCKAGTDKGFADLSELERVEAELKAADKTKNICLVMHHHPVPVSTPLIDEYILQDRQSFLERIKKYPAIKLIMCGHVHGDYSLKLADVNLESSPATCFQWKKGADKLETEEAVGYAIYSMRKDEFVKVTRWLTGMP